MVKQTGQAMVEWVCVASILAMAAMLVKTVDYDAVFAPSVKMVSNSKAKVESHE